MFTLNVLELFFAGVKQGVVSENRKESRRGYTAMARIYAVTC